LRGINSDCIDLIATDPPFKKGRDFHATPDSLAAGASFQDRWSWEKDVHHTWIDQIKDDYPSIWATIDVANAINMKKSKKNIQRPREEVGSDMGAFLCFLSVRLLEMHRVLKESGSIFLHCDYSAGHYIKMVLDAIFGRSNFQNEIIWGYKDVGGGRNTDYYKRKHDTIFWYVKNHRKKKICDLARGELSETTLNRFGSLFDARGVITYRTLKERRPTEFESRKNQGRVPENLDEVFLSKKRGRLLESYWTDINPVRERRKDDKPDERYWYPTQKPIALYERIINTVTSKKDDDVVLDPFCGCATTCVAAQKLGRQWIGIDTWEKAHEVVIQRLQEEGFLSAPGGDKRGRLFTEGEINYTKEPPERTDDGEEAVPFLKTKLGIDEPKGEKRTRAEMLEFLLSQHGSKCQGCDREFDDRRYLELDHNTPRSQGGLNHISNRILLCAPCNKVKSNLYTLEGLRQQNKQRGYMAK